jgi:hypothetical protein
VIPFFLPHILQFSVMLLPTRLELSRLHHFTFSLPYHTDEDIMFGNFVILILFFFCIDGFFDAGMLRQALNSNRAQVEPVERDVIRRNIGRRLRLAEY